MTITAEIIADSISEQGKRLTTYKLRYPRFIHAEFMTHRVFSRNASSSRAVPVERLITDIKQNPVFPSFWGQNQAGMQAREELAYNAREDAAGLWDSAMRDALMWASHLAAIGAHKQIVNRILEPFSHINVVCTATEYENFFALRRHKDAQPEIKMLADSMWDAQEKSFPTLLHPKEWHLPYYKKGIWKHHDSLPDPVDIHGVTLPDAIQMSVARCARTSYMTHEGKKPSKKEDLALYQRLVGSTPLHASPCEHQATPDIIKYHPHTNVTEFPSLVKSIKDGEVIKVGFQHRWDHPEEHGNLNGWRQYRKMLPNEYVPG